MIILSPQIDLKDIIWQLEQKQSSPRIDLNKIKAKLEQVSKDAGAVRQLKEYVLQGMSLLNSRSDKTNTGDVQAKAIRRAGALVRLGFLYEALLADRPCHKELITKEEAAAARKNGGPRIKLFLQKIYLTNPAGTASPCSDIASKYGVSDNSLGDLTKFSPVVDLREPTIEAYLGGNYGMMYSDAGLDGSGHERTVIPVRAETRDKNAIKTYHDASAGAAYNSINKALEELGKTGAASDNDRAILETCDELLAAVKSGTDDSSTGKTFLYSAVLSASALSAAGQYGSAFANTVVSMCCMATGYLQKAPDLKADKAPSFYTELARGRLARKLADKAEHNKYPDLTQNVKDICLSMQNAMTNIMGKEAVNSRYIDETCITPSYSDSWGGLAEDLNNLETEDLNLLKKLVKCAKDRDILNIPDNIWENLFCRPELDFRHKINISNLYYRIRDYHDRVVEKDSPEIETAEEEFDNDKYNDYDR